jgi:sarcosine oxidase subunit alpha
MRPQINRLPEAGSGTFSGSAINRNQPLRFRLDGRLSSGFVGDSVLSAVLASGIDTLGNQGDWPIALTPSASPSISLADRAGEPRHSLSMAQTPAIDGAEFVTLGARSPNPLARLFLPGRTLGLELGGKPALIRPWRGVHANERRASDLVVIGGGVAGMEAALTAAKSGLAVTLVEASATLGGHSGLFGTQDGELAPELEIARLCASIETSDAITVLLNSRAFAIRSGLVRVHSTELVDRIPEGKVIDLTTRNIVLATGSREKLPIFSGNRLPGVIGTLDAYQLATQYGVWPGQSALVSTASNFGYRLAMLASDAGLTVTRILDSRDRAASRFIEFSRAYGMIQMLGAQPQMASVVKIGRTLAVHTGRAGADALLTERLLVCGGWQPDLTLWHNAGGSSRWCALHNRLEARGHLDNIALAGSAAGYFTRQACVESGRDAVKLLLKRKRKPITDSVIDPLWESDDSTLPIAGSRENGAPAFLDSCSNLRVRPAVRKASWTDMIRRNRPQNDIQDLSETPEALSFGEIVAGVALGLVPSDVAGRVAQERVALVPLVSVEQAITNIQDDGPAALEIPSYLEGRFGPGARIVEIVPAEPRQFSSGALLYRTADSTNPLDAVGVILRHGEGNAIALVNDETAQGQLAITVRDQGRAIAARIVQLNNLV